jgi:hypothetical protein
MNLNLQEFLDAARWSFRFLERMGFAEEDLPVRRNQNPYELRYVSATTRVVVEGIDWGFSITARLGPRDEELVDLLTVVRLRDPEAAEHYAAAKGRDKQLRLFAEAVRCYGDDMLAGDFTLLGEIARRRRAATAITAHRAR